MSTVLSQLKNIKCIIMDVDGVLTDGSVVMTEQGEGLRRFNIKDGYAIQHAVKQGYHMAVISGGTSEGVSIRMKGLGLTEVHMSVKDKLGRFNQLLDTFDVKAEECLFMGDEMIDIPVLKKVGVACCPCDAAWQVREISHIVTRAKGGYGSAREVIEKIMTLQGKWMTPDSHVW